MSTIVVLPSLLPSLEALVNADGKFALHTEDTYTLLRLVDAISHHQVAMPNHDALPGVRSSADANDLPDYLGPIGSAVWAYSNARDHCLSFKVDKYPAVIGLASDVHNYARAAGSTTDESAYTVIFRSIRDLIATTDAQETQDLKRIVDDLIDAEVEKIDALTVKSRKAFTDLQEFEDQTIKDESLLRDCISNAKAALEMWGSAFEKALQDAFQDLPHYKFPPFLPYAGDATSVSYVWCECYGLIDTATVAGLYGHEAATIAYHVGHLEGLVSSQVSGANAGTGAIADLDAMAAALKDISGLSGTAIAQIELLIGTWGAVVDDLNNLQTMLNTDVRLVDEHVSPLVEKKMMHKWNTLADAVEEYLDAPYAAEVQQISLADFHKELRYRSTLEYPVPFKWPAAAREL